MKSQRKKVIVGVIVGAVVLFAGSTGWAIPKLQLYIEGAQYDKSSETWVLEDVLNTCTLWAIGDVDVSEPILDVHLAVAYNASLSPVLTIVGTTADPSLGFTDDSISAGPVYLKTVTDGSAPKLSDGKDLATHGIYEKAAWQEYNLGNFELTDSPIADFAVAFPSPLNKTGQINAYQITVLGLEEGQFLHFDLYNHVEGATKAEFAPFSHDAESDGGEGTTPGPGTVPEPGALAIWAVGLLGIGVYRRIRS